MSSDSELISTYAKKLGISDRKDILRDAGELLRQLTHSSQLASLKMTSSCQPLLCLQISSQRLQHNLDQKEVQKLAGVSLKQHLVYLNTVRAILGVSNVPTVEEVAVKMGCPQMREKALAVFEMYRKDCLSKLSVNRRKDANFEKPVYPCSAVYVACKAAKTKVDKKKLRDLFGVTTKELDDVIQAMEEARKSSSSLKRPPAEAENGVLKSIENEIGECSSSKKKRLTMNGNEKKVRRLNEEEDYFDLEDYQEWKEKMLKQAGIS